MSKISLAKLLHTEFSTLNETRANIGITCLGGLASWWLRPEVYQVADCLYERPTLPEGLGACWVLLAFFNESGEKNDDNAIFRPAAILPLRWKEDQPDDPKLPKELLKLADSVRQVLKGNNWGLCPGVSNFPDLSLPIVS